MPAFKHTAVFMLWLSVVPALFGFFLFPRNAHAQLYPFTTYDMEDGLPQSTIVSIYQDRDGYLWFGTDGGGVCRFDGFEFTVWSQAEGLTHENVNAITQDSHGALWFGTDQGAFRLHEGKLTVYDVTTGYQDVSIFAFLEGSDGEMLLGTKIGVLRLQDNRMEPYAATPVMEVRALHRDSAGILWAGTKQGLYRFADGVWSHTGARGVPLVNDIVWSLHEDRSGHLWIGTDTGAKRCALTVPQVRIENIPLTTQPVRSIHEDASGVLWFGTMGHGIFRYDGVRFEQFTVRHGLASANLWSIFADREGNIWCGTAGKGISRLRGTYSQSWNTDEGLLHDDVLSISQDNEGAVWIGTNGGGLARYTGGTMTLYTVSDGLPSDRVTALQPDQRGGLWIGTFGGGIARFDGRTFHTYTTANGLADDKVWSLHQDRRGTLWIGTNTGGICRYDGQRFSTCTTREGAPHALEIASITEDPVGTLYFASHGGGIWTYQGGEFSPITSAQGLSALWLFDAYCDSDGTFWAASSDGLFKQNDGLFERVCGDVFNAGFRAFALLKDGGHYYFGTENGLYIQEPATGTVRAFTTSDGLVSNTFNRGAIFRDRDGHLWLGTTGGVTRFSPGAYRINTVPTPVYLTNCRVNGHSVEQLDHMSLSHEQNNIDVSYIGLCYSNPRAVRYRYRLTGIDDDWQETTARSASYRYLPSGSYTFEITARNNDGYWNPQPTTLSFVILSPVWARWWFIAGAAMILIIVTTLVHRLRTRMYKRRTQLLEAAVTQRTQDLHQRTQELEQAKELLEDARDDLEAVVHERTENLQKTVTQLCTEVLEHQEAKRKLQSLASQLTIAEERQRRRIAVELHDRIGSNLSAIQRMLRMRQANQTGTPGVSDTSMLITVLEKTIQDTRSLALEISSHELFELGLETAIESLVAEKQEQSNIPIEFHNDGQSKPVGEDVRVLLYSATRELLNNMMKHAQAQSGLVAIAREDSTITITVVDDGTGFVQSQVPVSAGKSGGFGLYSIRERVQSTGGSLTIDSALGRGTRVRIAIPLGQMEGKN